MDKFGEGISGLYIAHDAERVDPAGESVTVASDFQLRSPAHFQRLAIATAALGLPRRAITDWLADVIYGYDGRILWPNGSEHGLPDIEEVFGDDGSYRWLGYFVKFAEEPPRQRPQARVVERLRVIDLAFKIAHPERARLIAR
ncbi:hypothetical protein A7A08_02355 [Methyloligella halotolerans]|uniref:Uncharacterized protein n=1 Tax=Methyloligella halotolerans TaxID=1177755 RepID=A0A1E2RWX6_9HYPH|nr:hypothetical protein [Methyloligella halotolerans]ODA66588.1 hypothetical protein A7A08_02355 [Methyloligella halotolerans]